MLLLTTLSKIKDSLKSLFYRPEQRRLRRRRQTFAKHIEYEVLRLDLLEDWKDDRFAELEAEVEAEGDRKMFSLIPFLNKTSDGLRREKSLSKALASSQARFVLVEGEPGSGKSVALRHVVQKMAAHAKKSRSLKSTIPIYVNLKELERVEGEAIDRSLIESFVKKVLARSNDRDVERFLDEQFSSGIENGTWFFLFDSFDEIPEILNSTEADAIIRSYGEAIADFLQGGMSTCRGVIASRQFRGPKQFGWPRFRILALTEDRRLELIHNADLEHELQDKFIGWLSTAPQEIRIMARNPLFLSLLCEHVKSGHQFPSNTHTVFETYVESRLKRDETRLQRRFNVNTVQIRTCAENIGFCMAADTGLGLSPTREALRTAMTGLGMDITDDFDTLLDALEYTKLCRPGTGMDTNQPKQFTFAHRRFQEYFATCVVLRDSARVSPTQLLTNARWRETAVAMCQTQPASTLTPMIEQIERLLTQFCSNIPNLIDDPTKYIDCEAQSKISSEKQVPRKFPWPPSSLHLLSLLQEGFAGHLENLSNMASTTTHKQATTFWRVSPLDMTGGGFVTNGTRVSVSKLLLSATETGVPEDGKWALEMAGTASEPTLSYLLRKAFLSRSQWLREVAYRQVSCINDIPTDIAKGIHHAIAELEVSNRLHKEKHATMAHLSRLHQPARFLSTMRLLLYLPTIDAIWNIVLLICLARPIIRTQSQSSYLELVVLILSTFITYIIFWKLLPIIFTYRSNLITNRMRMMFMYKFIITFLPLSLALSSLLFISFSDLFIYKTQSIHHSLLSLPSIISFLLTVLLVFAYLSTISVAFWSGSIGFLNYWLLWATIPFYSMPWLLLYTYAEFSHVIRFLRKNYLKLFIVLLMPMLLYILSILNFFFFTRFMLSLTLIEILLFTFAVIRRGCRYLRDRWQWHVWSVERKKLMTYREFWKAVNSYRTTQYRTKMIRVVREQAILVTTGKTEDFLRKIVWESEKKLTGEETSKPKKKKGSGAKRYRTISWIDYTAIDELSKLIESIRISKEGIHTLS